MKDFIVKCQWCQKLIRNNIFTCTRYLSFHRQTTSPRVPPWSFSGWQIWCLEIWTLNVCTEVFSFQVISAVLQDCSIQCCSLLLFFSLYNLRFIYFFYFSIVKQGCMLAENFFPLPQLGTFTPLVGGPEYVHCLLVRFASQLFLKRGFSSTANQKQVCCADTCSSDPQKNASLT